MRRADPEKMHFRGGKDNGCGEKMLILVGTVVIENRVPVTPTKLETHDAETRLHDSEKQGQGQPVTHFVILTTGSSPSAQALAPIEEGA